MTDNERRGLDLLTHHAKRLALLIELLGGSDRVAVVRVDTRDLARELYRETRLELQAGLRHGRVAHVIEGGSRSLPGDV